MTKIGRGGGAAGVVIGLATAQQWRLARFVATFDLDEQDLVDTDDTVGSLILAVEQIGAAARNLIPDLVYSLILNNAVLTDGVALFATARANKLTAAFNSTALQAGYGAIASQVLQAEDSAGSRQSGPAISGCAARFSGRRPAVRPRLQFGRLLRRTLRYAANRAYWRLV